MEFKIENKHLGTMYLDHSEKDRIKLLDSNGNYIGYNNLDDYGHDLDYFFNKLKELYDITKLVDLGFCNNMIFGKSVDDLAEVYQDYINDKYVGEKEISLEEAKEEIASLFNVIGNDYFLVDYDEL